MSRTILLIGHPVSHSVSPVFQQAALNYYSLDVTYSAVDVVNSDLPNLVDSLRNEEFVGANVTVPYKETVTTLLNQLEEKPKLIGAVNTIENRSGILVGHNTDAEGFVMALENEKNFNANGKKAVILGAGGSAKAVIAGLTGAGIKTLVIVNRTLSRGQDLVGRFGSLVDSISVVPLDSNNLKEDFSNADLIVNCTSLGMNGGPDPSSSLVSPEIFPSNVLVADLVYNPTETPLLRNAAKVGLDILNGLPMLVYQGAASFELWTGKSAPVKEMFKAAEIGLRNKS